jgi:hypothetical protein
VDRAAALHRERGLDLLVIDPLAAFLPGRGENDAGLLLTTLAPLRDLTRLGVAVLLLHHSRKGATLAGQAARGSGALGGFADILIEMQWAGKPEEQEDRRRRLFAYSRHDATPRHQLIERTADGTDFLAVGPAGDPAFDAGWDVLWLVLEDATDKLTRKQIREQWPEDFPRPGDVTLWQWLTRAVTNGRVAQEGSGRRADPYRYWLPGAEKSWLQNPLERLRREHLEVVKKAQDQIHATMRRLTGQ